MSEITERANSLFPGVLSAGVGFLVGLTPAFSNSARKAVFLSLSDLAGFILPAY